MNRKVEEDNGDSCEEAHEAGRERDEVEAGRHLLHGRLHLLPPPSLGLLVRRSASNPKAHAPAAATGQQGAGRDPEERRRR